MEPNSYYKVVSAYITLTMDQNIIERQTYSFLEWLGDIGGLYDALRIIGVLAMWPFTSFKLKSELLSNVFRFTKSKRKADREANDNEFSMTQDFQKSTVQDPRQPPSYITGDKNLEGNMRWDF